MRISNASSCIGPGRRATAATSAGLAAGPAAAAPSGDFPERVVHPLDVDFFFQGRKWPFRTVPDASGEIQKHIVISASFLLHHPLKAVLNVLVVIVRVLDRLH